MYKAYDPNTDRYVALKVVSEHLWKDRKFRRRFRREVKAIARLEHRSILPVFAYGEEDDTAYLAMRYMEPGTLSQRIMGKALPLDETSRLLHQIASALDYAHGRGVLHRDVKPKNVLLDELGNAYLTDFGIAKILEATIDLTGDAILGTPKYMSPEQCRGEKNLTPATDVYSLGIVLFEMLTGRPPFDAEAPLAVINMQLHEPLPRSLRPDLPDEAERALFKALAKKPDERYQSAGELARAFAQAVAEAPVGVDPLAETVTDPDLVPEKAKPGAMRRIPGWAWAAGGVLVVIATFGTLVASEKIDIDLEGTPPEPPETAAGESEAIGVRETPAGAAIAPVATMAPAATTVTVAPATGKIAFTSARDGDSEIYVMNADGSGHTNLTNHPAFDEDPTWSPDGSQIAFISDRDGDSEIYVMNADGSGQTNLTNIPGANFSPAWSPDGTQIAFTSARDVNNFEIYVMNADGSGQTNLTNNPAQDSGPAWSPDGTQIAFVSERDGLFQVYIMNADGTGQTNLTNHASRNYDPAWSPDGTQIAFNSGRDGPLCQDIYHINTTTLVVVRLTSDPCSDSEPAWSPDGTQIAFTSDRDSNGEIYVMNDDGTGQTNLTNNPALDTEPAWSPGP
ncbi:MAG: PD40 domain-containing protein [Chloroflexi bacterium]|nr:PD40 domain-containing protein [Chloroflexota bacterium]